MVRHTHSNSIFMTVIQEQLEPIFTFNAQELQACVYVAVFWRTIQGTALFSRCTASRQAL